MMAASLFGLISILVYLGIIVFIIYVALTILKLMKQKNEYLKDIRDEIKKSNSINQLNP
ncbi:MULTISPECIES: hypothetical protein [unclassified Bacillus (in: firmicutes)]|mgnify:FL=1|jgi:hypothetical protein|uniref:hypothetical protein n=1 Tax=unclassified Bacillus (in: firmicutes) TaxID=185979 RepID=UPI001585862E|nr:MULTISPECIES: hypothetical protein [unclassified Bacillus (in: firmicutes)]